MSHLFLALQVVIVCEPESASLMMGGLHPRASLYERPVNIESAKATHALFRQVRPVPVVIVRNRTVWYDSILGCSVLIMLMRWMQRQLQLHHLLIVSWLAATIFLR